MKRKLVLICLLNLSIYLLSAQPKFKIADSWHYKYYFSFVETKFGYDKISIVRDTIVNDSTLLVCKKIRVDYNNKIIDSTFFYLHEDSNEIKSRETNKSTWKHFIFKSPKINQEFNTYYKIHDLQKDTLVSLVVTTIVNAGINSYYSVKFKDENILSKFSLYDSLYFLDFGNQSLFQNEIVYKGIFDNYIGGPLSCFATENNLKYSSFNCDSVFKFNRTTNNYNNETVFNVWPNTVENFINFNLPVNSVVVIDIFGNKFEFSSENSFVFLDLSSLKSGFYIMYFDNQFKFKLIKK